MAVIPGNKFNFMTGHFNVRVWLKNFNASGGLTNSKEILLGVRGDREYIGEYSQGQNNGIVLDPMGGAIQMLWELEFMFRDQTPSFNVLNQTRGRGNIIQSWRFPRQEREGATQQLTTIQRPQISPNYNQIGSVLVNVNATAQVINTGGGSGDLLCWLNIQVGVAPAGGVVFSLGPLSASSTTTSELRSMMCRTRVRYRGS